MPTPSNVTITTISNVKTHPNPNATIPGSILIGVWEETETKTWIENAVQSTVDVHRIPPDCWAKTTRQLYTVTRQSQRHCEYEPKNNKIKFTAAGVGGALAAAALVFGALAITVATGGAGTPLIVGALGAASALTGGGAGVAFKTALDAEDYTRGALQSCTDWSDWVIVNSVAVGAPNVQTAPIPCDRPVTQPLWEPAHEDGFDGTALSNISPVISIPLNGE